MILCARGMHLDILTLSSQKNIQYATYWPTLSSLSR